MEVLVLDGKNYVKASKAAKDLGYATDYVGQLCRSGQVDSHLIGRTWYVNQEELSTHRVEKKRMSRVKAREYAKRTIEEYRTQNEKPQKTYNSVAISYEKDTEALIPETRKVTVVSEREKKHFNVHSKDEGDRKELVNKGEKILMEGNLNVVDVTDGEIDDSTTILKPKVFASTPELTEKKRVVDDIPAIETQAETIVPMKRSFIEKLEAKDVHAEERTTEETLPVIEPILEANPVTTSVVSPIQKFQREDMSIFSALTIVAITTVIVTSTLSLFKVITYTKDNVGTVSVHTGISFSIEKAKQILKFTL